MKYLDFEKHIKNEFHNSTETVQMDALLASLNLGKKKSKRKGLVFWMIVPFLLLMISVFVWNFMGSKSDIDTGNDLINEVSSIQHSQSELLSLNEEHIENKVATARSSNQNFNNNQVETEAKVSNSLTQKQSTVTNSLDSSTSKATNFNNTSKDNSLFEQRNQNSKPLSFLKKVSNLNTSYININGNDEVGNQLKNNTKNLTSVDIETKQRKDLVAISGLNNSFEGLKENELDEKLFSRMKINCPSFDNSRWHMALIPEVGLFHPIKTLENKTIEESASFNERFKSEHTLEGIELGLYGMLVRDNVPLYLKAGVSYSRISERMDLKYEYTEQDTMIGIISSTISGNGDTITHIYGEIVTETTFKGSNRQHHYIHLFDIPISVGYTTYFAGLDIGIEAGVKVNFMTRATGNLLTSGTEYTNLSLNKLFKNRIGLSYFGGLMIGRNFGRLGDIYIAPRFTYFPNSFNNQNNPISQRYFNIGLSAGVVYKIN